MQSKFKKLSLVLILLGVVLAFCSSAFAAGIAEGWRAAFWDEASGTYKVGSTADFLGYNWALWKTDGTYAYVITSDILTNSKFQNSYSSNNYRNSTVRGVVNGYENKMKGYSGNGSGTKSLTWKEINGGSANFIEHSPTIVNGAGTDYLYLLAYVEANSIPMNIRKLKTTWWLRSPASSSTSYSYRADAVSGFDGKLSEYSVGNNKGVRPALIINLKSPLFSSALFRTAPSGKADASEGGGFTLKDYDGADGWKLTVTDKNIKTPRVLLGADGGKKIAVYYTFESAGENMYLSALLYDADGKLINYAKIAKTAEKIKGVTIVDLPLDNIKPGNYKMRFFQEQIKGAEENDIASALTQEYDLCIPAQPSTAVLQNANSLVSNTSLNSVSVASQENSVALLDEDYKGVSGVNETILKDGLNITLTYDGDNAVSETAQFQIKLDRPIELAEGGQLAVFIPLPDRTEEDEYLVLKDEDPADDMITFTVPNVGEYFESGETVPVMLAEINGDAKFDGEEEQKKSSSGGCNAGFGAHAMLGVLGMFYSTKK